MKLIILESPYAGNVEVNTHYARFCMKQILLEGNCVFASHLLYTQCLDDMVPEERDLGIKAGLEFYKHADECHAFIDHGISKGMRAGIKEALDRGVPVYLRQFGLKFGSQIHSISDLIL
jgi:hypothetical protein